MNEDLIWRHPKFNCEHALSGQSYSKKHDSYYCEECDKWLEKSCKDKACDFCGERPAKPSEVKEHG